jgi:hypothetical protein
MTRSLKWRLGLVVPILVLAGWGVRGGAQQPPANSPSLVGAWMGTGTFSTGETFRTLVTYHADGGFILSDTASLFVPVSHGVWTQTGAREFATTFVQYAADKKGELDIIVKVRETITMDETGDRYTVRFKSQVFDRLGKAVASLTGTGTGTRIRVEPL